MGYLPQCFDEALDASYGAGVCGDRIEVEKTSCLIGQDLLEINFSGLVNEVCDLRKERCVFGVELEAVVKTAE